MKVAAHCIFNIFYCLLLFLYTFSIVEVSIEVLILVVPVFFPIVFRNIIILVIVSTKMILADPYLMERVWRWYQRHCKTKPEVEA